MKPPRATPDHRPHQRHRAERSRRHKVDYWHARAAADLRRLGAPQHAVEMLAAIVEALDCAGHDGINQR